MSWKDQKLALRGKGSVLLSNLVISTISNMDKKWKNQKWQLRIQDG